MDGVKFGAPYAPPLAVAAPPAVDGDPYAARRLGSLLMWCPSDHRSSAACCWAGWWLWLPCRSVDMVGVRLMTNYRAKINETLVRNRDHETGTSRTYERIERAGDGAYNLTKGLPVEING